MLQYNCFPLWISVFCPPSSLSPVKRSRSTLSLPHPFPTWGWLENCYWERRTPLAGGLTQRRLELQEGAKCVSVTRGLGRRSNQGEGSGWDHYPCRVPTGGGLSGTVGGRYAKPEPTPPGFSPHSGFCNTLDSIAGTRRRKQMEFWVCLCPHPNPQPWGSSNMAARVVESTTHGFNWTVRFLGTDSPAHFLPR